MTIKKKDGNVYTLQGPNKLNKNQEVFDLNKCIFHNFKWNEITSKQIKNKPKEIIIKEKEEIKEEKEEVITEVITEEAKEEEIEEEVEIKQKIELPKIKYKVLAHCLPAEIKNYKDEFYGESWQKTTYSKKFIFPLVIISNNDLVLEFWTSDPENKINKNSIIYPFSYEVYNEKTSSYDKVPYDEYRWWKVIEKKEKDKGYIISSIPSQDHPDFSD